MNFKVQAAAFALVATIAASTIGPAAAQDTTTRRASQFDIGIYSGGAWTTDWFVGAEAGAALGTSHFAELDPFNVNMSALGGGIYGGVSVPVSPNMAVGIRAGVLFFGGHGTHEPFPGFQVKTELNELFYLDVEAAFPLLLRPTFSSTSPDRIRPPTISVFVGPAYGNITVTGTPLGGPAISDSQSIFGFTAGGRLDVPVLPNFALNTTLRYVHLPSKDFRFPGTAPVDGDFLIVTIGGRLSVLQP